MSDFTNEVLHHAQDLLDELTLLVESDGKGTKRISKHLELILHMRLFDRRMDEIRYQVSTGYLEDATTSLENLSTTILDKF